LLVVSLTAEAELQSLPSATMEEDMTRNELKLERAKLGRSGRVLVPALLWMAGVPFGIVLLLWFFFFRG
jgi:hypothetical protein